MSQPPEIEKQDIDCEGRKIVRPSDRPPPGVRVCDRGLTTCYVSFFLEEKRVNPRIPTKTCHG